MNDRIRKIENDVQDRNSVAWKKLCKYVDLVARENREEFSPAEAIGGDLFSQIHTLPETISKLKAVKKVFLYGSKLKRIPPEIGQMEALEQFIPYTSYDLNWFPFELTQCQNLKNSTVSTRALYGNYKYRTPFPDLKNNPIRYEGQTLHCSICKKEITYQQTNQLWISLWVGTDTLPLLVNSCSKECESKLPKPPEDYVQFAHKGGSELEQPLDERTAFEIEYAERQRDMPNLEINLKQQVSSDTKTAFKDLPLIRLVRKIFGR